MSQIRSRVICPDSDGPWIEGGMEDLMVHFTYASWTAYNLGCALSMALASKEEELGKTVSDMMTRMISRTTSTSSRQLSLPRGLEVGTMDRVPLCPTLATMGV